MPKWVKWLLVSAGFVALTALFAVLIVWCLLYLAMGGLH